LIAHRIILGFAYTPYVITCLDEIETTIMVAWNFREITYMIERRKNGKLDFLMPTHNP
jgi:hypothetical protein